MDVFSLIKKDMPFCANGNIVHFILNDADRPWWSTQLEGFFKQNNNGLNMSRNYKSQKHIMTSNSVKKRFVDFVAKKQGVKVDLASGPSGYFSAILDDLAENDLFIITDACPTVIAAHSKANTKNNVYVFDVDLDKKLPFENASIDVISGNLLSNVNNYAELINEVYRCLKVGGHFAIIDMFFEHGCSTYEHLKDKGEVWASFETFVTFCESVGFVFLDSDVISSRKGKLSSGDLYPLDENDCWSDRTLYFTKK